MSGLECDACSNVGTSVVNIKYSIDNIVGYIVCDKHRRMALNKLKVFLKHVRTKNVPIMPSL